LARPCGSIEVQKYDEIPQERYWSVEVSAMLAAQTRYIINPT